MTGPDPDSTADQLAPHSIEYQPALDGLRAVAVLLVLVYHHYVYPQRPGGLHGGFLGVDVFFVLSGFLITSLLLAEHSSTGRIALRSFWARRARRLLPALLVMLLIVAAYAASVALPTDLARIRGDAVATLFYVQNWRVISAGLQSGSILSHAWSLSVEEQWYLVWPALLGLLLSWRRVGRSRVGSAIVGLAVVSALWTYVLHVTGPALLHVYYGTDTRAQELLVGAALAALLRKHGANADSRHDGIETIGVVGCFVVGAIILTTRPQSPFFATGGYLVFSIAVAAVIAAAVRRSSTIVRPVLSVAPLRAIGLISYGMYLYHWPLYWFLTPQRTHVSDLALFVVRLAATVVVATLSFFLIERPVRRGALRGVTLRLAAPVAVAATLAAVLVATHIPTPSPLVSSRAIAAYQRAAAAPGRRVLVVGHGLAFGLEWTGGRYQRDGLNAIAAGFLDCSFVAGDINGDEIGTLPEALHCNQLLVSLRGLHDAFRPDTVVLLPDNQELYDRRVGSHIVHVGSLAWSEYATAQLDATIAAVAGPEHRPVLLATVPCSGAPSDGSAFDAVVHSPERRRALNQLLDTYAASHRATVTPIDLDGLLCRNGTPIHQVDGRQIVDARGALTRFGADYVWGWIATQITHRAPRVGP